MTYTKLKRVKKPETTRFPIYHPISIYAFDIVSMFVPYRQKDDPYLKYIDYDRLPKNIAGKTRPMVVIGHDLVSNRIILAPCSSRKSDDYYHKLAYRYPIKACHEANLACRSEIFVNNFIAVRPQDIQSQTKILGHLPLRDRIDYHQYVLQYYLDRRTSRTERLMLDTISIEVKPHRYNLLRR